MVFHALLPGGDYWFAFNQYKNRMDGWLAILYPLKQNFFDIRRIFGFGEWGGGGGSERLCSLEPCWFPLPASLNYSGTTRSANQGKKLDWKMCLKSNPLKFGISFVRVACDLWSPQGLRLRRKIDRKVNIFTFLSIFLLSLYRAAVACAIVERSSGFEASSETNCCMVFEAGWGTQHLSFHLYIPSFVIRSGCGVVDNTLDYQSRDRKIDPPLLRSLGWDFKPRSCLRMTLLLVGP